MREPMLNHRFKDIENWTRGPMVAARSDIIAAMAALVSAVNQPARVGSDPLVHGVVDDGHRRLAELSLDGGVGERRIFRVVPCHGQGAIHASASGSAISSTMPMVRASVAANGMPAKH